MFRLCSNSEYYHADALGSVLSLTDQTGALRVTYNYEPFGRTSINGTSTNFFQFTGRENDGIDLYYYRARYYSPILHRFVSEDPIGFKGGFNFYSYVKNNPIRFKDPFGLKPDDPDDDDCELTTASGKIGVMIPCTENGQPPPEITPAGSEECTLDAGCFASCFAVACPGALALTCAEICPLSPQGCGVCAAIACGTIAAVCNSQCQDCTC